MTRMIEKRYDDLLAQAERLSSVGIGLPGYKTLPHLEYQTALLQHYELAKTNLLDLTQSLLVAATFALSSKAKNGWLFVFGMPHPQGSISHFVDDEIVMVKLQNACPPTAWRPHHQEAFLVGRFPFFPKKEAGDNAARRLIGKYLLQDTDDGFWESFKPVPDEWLFPSDDPFGRQVRNLLREPCPNPITGRFDGQT